MEWFNYHHLRYFWAVAKQGSLKEAARKLHVSQPSISAQVKELEETLGEPLFRRAGRANVLTDAGQIALRYADEIFALGSELINTIKQRPGAQSLRLYVGIADALPKLITNEILKPVFAMPQNVYVICREGKLEDLLAQLASHRLDIVLADEPATSVLNIRCFSHLLGESGVTFCARGKLAARLRPGFPKSLHGAPALLPAENSAMRRSLEQWFQRHRITPRVIAEFEDAALMKVMAADGGAFIPVSTAVLDEALTRYGLRVIGPAEQCNDPYYAITGERRITHPAVVVITDSAQHLLAK
jgi:LysR family transcriptional regulator, transcriptional activator of nhaA